MITVVRRRSFRDVREKAAYMQEAACDDARTPMVFNTAARFRTIRDPWQRARAILQFCQYCIEYVRDPGPCRATITSPQRRQLHRPIVEA